MERRFDVMDAVVAVGLLATILAGGMLFMVANGQLAVTPSWQGKSEQLSDHGDGMPWLQPVLGQAVVDQAILERHDAKVLFAAKKQLEHVTSQHLRWQNSPFGYLESIKTAAARAEFDHATRVQWVMGKSIVNFTSRGVRSRTLSPAGGGTDYSSRMIGATSAQRRRMDAQFLAHWQPTLGRTILKASQHDREVSELRQKRLGVAIVRLTAAQTASEGRRAAIQEQLGGASVVAILTESRAVSSAPRHPVQALTVTTAARLEWSNLPPSSIVVASLILMSLFVIGLGSLQSCQPRKWWKRVNWSLSDHFIPK